MRSAARERRVIYVSHSLINGDLGRLEALRHACIRGNQKNQISGVLYYDNLVFFQVLEGAAPKIESLMARISADKRHKEIVPLANLTIEDRLFDDWGMKFVSGLLNPQLAERFTYGDLRHAPPRVLGDRVQELFSA